MRAVLCGYYGKGNSGDEALLATLLQMLPKSVTPIVLSGNPEQTRQQYGVEVCDRNSSFSILSTFKEANAFIFGGGSLIQDSTSTLSPIYYAGLMGLAQQMGLTTLAWSQGIGPLNRAFTRWMAQQTFRGCSSVSVRDGGSAQQLKDWQIDCLLAPDPVWALDAIPYEPLKLPGPRIVVCLRPHPSLTPERLNRLGEALVSLQESSGASILLLPFQPIQDRAIAKQLKAQLKTKNHGPCQIIEIEDPRYLKGIFQQVDMTISMRLHGLIMLAFSSFIMKALADVSPPAESARCNRSTSLSSTPRSWAHSSEQPYCRSSLAGSPWRAGLVPSRPSSWAGRSATSQAPSWSLSSGTFH